MGRQKGRRVYGKLFEQMFDGTLATQGPWQALVTFQQLIILADKTGCVDMTPEAISRRTTIPLEIIETGLKTLSEPDPNSRTPAEEGRRIVGLSPERNWGWRIVNYEHYRKIRSEEERREYHRRYYHLKRKLNTSTETRQTQPIAVSSKQYAVKTLNSSAAHAAPHKTNNSPKDESPILAKLPLRGGGEFEVRQAFVAELEPIYPDVNVTRTVLEMRGWCLGNPDRMKTRKGIKRFITSWLQNEQEKGDA